MNKDTTTAFPIAGNNIFQASQEGMLLRDYFAAKALQGLLAGPRHAESVAYLVQLSYQLADMAMKERAK